MPSTHIIESGRNGTPIGETPDLDIVRARLRSALKGDRIVLHFHGGLVPAGKAKAEAADLGGVYAEAGADAVFFVWHSDALTIIRNNLDELASEALFGGITRRILGWAVGRLRASEGGARATDTTAYVPGENEISRELDRRFTPGTDEPFDGEEKRRAQGDEMELTPQEQNDFLFEVENDVALTNAALAAIKARGMQYNGAGGRGDPVVAPVPSNIDDEALSEVAQGELEGARGLVSTFVLAKKLLVVLKAVLRRFADQTDHGIYPTVIEEVMREFYVGLIAGAVWNAMKKETLDTFGDNGVGMALLDELATVIAERTAQGRAAPGILLVGHSTGAVFINNLLDAIVRDTGSGRTRWPADLRFDVALLAPACTYLAFARTAVSAKDLFGSFRMFTMTDEYECKDRLFKSVYPRSLLYLVSGALERAGTDSRHVPVLGQSRYLADARSIRRFLASDVARDNRIDEVRRFMAEKGRTAFSITVVGSPSGWQASAIHHGEFPEDSDVRASLQVMIRGLRS